MIGSLNNTWKIPCLHQIDHKYIRTKDDDSVIQFFSRLNHQAIEAFWTGYFISVQIRIHEYNGMI